MKINEVVYYCLDAIKAFSDDSYVNEEHILFLLGKYRGALLQQYHNIKKMIPESNYQIISLNLKEANMLPCTPGPRLMSVEKLPTLMTIGKPSILLVNGLESEIIEFVPFSRLKAVGWNKWKKNFIYAAIGTDGHLYMVFTNPQAQYLSMVRLKGIFEDFEKALDLGYVDSENNDGNDCDLMEREFPLEVSLIPDLIARVVKDALGVLYRPSDPSNNAADDLADIVSYVRRNMKSQYAKQLEGED